jgi:spore maturation protein CgeB
VRNRLRFCFLGLSITSSWGNGHATTYRSLLRALAARGHELFFFERDLPWYAESRDLPMPPYAATFLYDGVEDLKQRFGDLITAADVVIVGSFVPEGVAVGGLVLENARGVTAFYDIDTPITLKRLHERIEDYISPQLVSQYDLYLSFTGGPLLARMNREFGAKRPRALYCSFDPDLYHPEPSANAWALGYLGTYSEDRQPALSELLIRPAERLSSHKFIVAGAQYPQAIKWPGNVEYRAHVSPLEHRAFYSAQRFTLNVTRLEMRRWGYSPSVRLFEAAGCGVPIITDRWPGIEEIFLDREELLTAETSAEVIDLISHLSEAERTSIGARGREKVLRHHTAAHRAATLEKYVAEVLESDTRKDGEERVSWQEYS